MPCSEDSRAYVRMTITYASSAQAPDDMTGDTLLGTLVSVSSDMPRLAASHPVFQLQEPLPAAFSISVEDTMAALRKGPVPLGDTTTYDR